MSRHIRTPFMDPLVLAIAADLRGAGKTVTRRLFKLPRIPAGDVYPPDWAEHAWTPGAEDDPHLVVPVVHDGRPNLLSVPCRAAPGDIMDVCEALVPMEARDHHPVEFVSYRADDEAPVDADGFVIDWPWKVRTLPARYCPAWAVRHHRRLISVRPERLSDVTDAEAVLEGIRYLGWPETRAGFIEGFMTMHKLDSDRVWVERREWAPGEAS